MHIDIYFDYLIDLIREAHTAEETAQILRDICNLDEAIGEDFSNKNEEIFAHALLKQYTLEEIISQIDNPEIVIRCAFIYLKGRSENDLDMEDLATLLDMLVKEGYIFETGLKDFDGNEISYWKDTWKSFTWSEEELKCDAEYADIIRFLINSYMKEFDGTRYCTTDKIWTNDPYEYIKQRMFDAYDFRGEFADSFYEYLPLIKADNQIFEERGIDFSQVRSKEEMKQVVQSADYKTFIAAWGEFLDCTNFLDESGIFDNYFG